MPITVHHRPVDTLSQADIDRWAQVPVAVAVDISNAACQLDPAIRPLCPPGQQPRLFGRAVTALCEPPDFGAVLQAVDLIRPGEVLVIAAGGNVDTAMLGEILGEQLRRVGGRGVVCDGAIRDVAQLARWPELSIYARAITPRGPTTMERGEVNGDVPIGNRLIRPGNLLIGDDDGLAVLSPDAIRALIDAAEAKLAQERGWRARLASGTSVAETLGLPPARQA